MQILLSCAKTMASKTKTPVPFTTTPIYSENASTIALYMTQRTVSELEELLGVNSNIALQNHERYQVFHSPDTISIPALLAYTGIVFKRIDVGSFSEADFIFAQDHLLLTSFAYGLLRPLDVIKPYRLEGAVKLEELGGNTLFNYWKGFLTDKFIESIKAKGGILCFLASNEMKQLFHWNKVEEAVQVIVPEFKVWRAGELKTVVVYTKMCRGEMTRFIIKNQIKDLDELKTFEWDGFMYNDHLSEGNNWVFTSDTK